jgi:hypothetical protein
MSDFENPVAVYRRTIKRQEKHRLTHDRQAELQRKAVEAHEAKERETKERWDALQIEQPNESRATAPARLKPISQPKRVSRVAAARAQQRATHKEDKS